MSCTNLTTTLPMLGCCGEPPGTGDYTLLTLDCEIIPGSGDNASQSEEAIEWVTEAWDLLSLGSLPTENDQWGNQGLVQGLPSPILPRPNATSDPTIPRLISRGSRVSSFGIKTTYFARKPFGQERTASVIVQKAKVRSASGKFCIIDEFKPIFPEQHSGTEYETINCQMVNADTYILEPMHIDLSYYTADELNYWRLIASENGASGFEFFRKAFLYSPLFPTVQPGYCCDPHIASPP